MLSEIKTDFQTFSAEDINSTAVIKITFDVDAIGRLSVEVVDLRNGHQIVEQITAIDPFNRRHSFANEHVAAARRAQALGRARTAGRRDHL